MRDRIRRGRSRISLLSIRANCYLGPMNTIIILSGMALEIVGALLLAIDAIGVDRVRNWAGGPTVVRRILSGVSPETKRHSAILVAFILVVVAYALGGYAAAKLDWLFDGNPGMQGALGFLVGLGVALSALELFRFLLLGITAVLLSATGMAERRTAAILGAVLLVVGFSMQFFGTLTLALE